MYRLFSATVHHTDIAQFRFLSFFPAELPRARYQMNGRLAILQPMRTPQSLVLYYRSPRGTRSGDNARASNFTRTRLSSGETNIVRL